jgi:hypothetical protein
VEEGWNLLQCDLTQKLANENERDLTKYEIVYGADEKEESRR